MKSHSCSHAFAAIVLANLFSLVALNGLELPTTAVLWVWPLSAAAAYLLLRGIHWRKARFPVPIFAVVLVVAWIVLLTAPRLPYLLARIPNNQAYITGDDESRMAELVTLTQSPHYPLRHPSNQAYLLSHYYSAFLPMAWIHFAIPALTLRECVLLGNLVYHILLGATLLEFVGLFLPTAKSAIAFVFLMTFFGGVDWVTTLPLLFDHHEQWFHRLFGEWREVSSMYTTAWWAVHHSVGLWTLLVACALLRYARWRQRWRKPFVLGLLLLSVFYTSVFVLFALPFIAPRALWRIGFRNLRNGLFIPIVAIACVPAFLLFGRVSGPGLTLELPRLTLLLAFLLGVLILDLALLPLLVWNDPRMRGAALFFLCTLFVSSVGLNNITMRGLLLPVTMLYYCASFRLAEFSWRRPAAILAIALTTIGVLREAAWLTYVPLERMPIYWKLTRRPMPAFAIVDERKFTGLNRFNDERMHSSVPLEQMSEGERDLLRLPRNGWFR